VGSVRKGKRAAGFGTRSMKLRYIIQARGFRPAVQASPLACDVEREALPYVRSGGTPSLECER
jgi:hypothetical protein